MPRPKYVGSITFRGFGMPAAEVESLIGVKASLLADRGSPLKPGAGEFVRSAASWSLDFPDSTRLDEMIPRLISHLGGAASLADAKRKVAPEFFELDLAMFIRDSQEQEGGFFENESLSIVSALGLRLSLGFYERGVA